MSDADKPLNDIEALAAKAQEMLERVRASASTIESAPTTSAESVDAEVQILDAADELDDQIVEADVPETSLFDESDDVLTDLSDEDFEPSGIDAENIAVDLPDPIEPSSIETELPDLAELHTDLPEVDEELADLPDLPELDTDLETTDLDLPETDLETTDLESADLVGDDLDPETSDISDTDLETSDLDPDLETSDLDSADLETSDLDSADLDSTDLDSTAIVEDELDLDLAETSIEDEVGSAAEAAEFMETAPLETSAVRDDIEVAWPEFESSAPSFDGDAVSEGEDEITLMGQQTIDDLDELTLDSHDSNDTVVTDLDDLDTEETAEDVAIAEPALGGLGLNDDGKFDDLEFRDVLDGEPGETLDSEAEFAAAFEAEGIDANLDPETKLVPLGITNQQEIDDLHELLEEANTPKTRGPLNPLLLLLILVPLLVLVFFGDRIFDRSDDATGEVETGVTEPVESVATEAPTTTVVDTTTEAPTTQSPETTQAPTTAPPAQTAWDLLGGDTNTSNFVNLASPFGLQSLLEGNSPDTDAAEFTVFSPSNAALAALTPEQLSLLTADPQAAMTLINYHIVEGLLTPEDLAGTETLQTLSGDPINVSVEGNEIVLNGSVVIPSEALEATTGNVIVIPQVLQPPVTVNQALDLGNIQFETFSDVITAEGIAVLAGAVEFFDDNPDSSAVVEGHTDSDGPPDGNQRLSQRRAQAVVDYLVSQGVDRSRLEAQGFGETQPIIVNGVEDKEASRRIEIIPG